MRENRPLKKQPNLRQHLALTFINGHTEKILNRELSSVNDHTRYCANSTDTPTSYYLSFNYVCSHSWCLLVCIQKNLEISNSPLVQCLPEPNLFNNY